MEIALRQGGDKPRLVRSLGFGAKGAEGDPKPQMFNMGFGAKGAEGDPKPQMFNMGKRSWTRA